MRCLCLQDGKVVECIKPCTMEQMDRCRKWWMCNYGGTMEPPYNDVEERA